MLVGQERAAGSVQGRDVQLQGAGLRCWPLQHPQSRVEIIIARSGTKIHVHIQVTTNARPLDVAAEPKRDRQQSWYVCN